MIVERASVVTVIHSFADWLATSEEAASGPVDECDAAFPTLVATCLEHGITIEEFRDALESDPSLADLARQAMLSKLVDTPDPGPYDSISRESPSGQPGDLHKFRSVPRREAPRRLLTSERRSSRS